MAVNYFFKLELYRVEEGRQGEENLRSVLRATCIPVPFSVEASTDPAHPIRGEREKREVREAFEGYLRRMYSEVKDGFPAYLQQHAEKVKELCLGLESDRMPSPQERGNKHGN